MPVWGRVRHSVIDLWGKIPDKPDWMTSCTPYLLHGEEQRSGASAPEQAWADFRRGIFLGDTICTPTMQCEASHKMVAYGLSHLNQEAFGNEDFLRLLNDLPQDLLVTFNLPAAQSSSLVVVWEVLRFRPVSATSVSQVLCLEKRQVRNAFH